MAAKRALTLALPLVFAAFSGSTAALARPADCLIVVEGKTLLDGPCDFKPDPGEPGSFAITGKGIKANVSVFKGAGIAYYEVGKDAWKLGDVKRDGACWVNRMGKICSWAPGTRPVAAAKPAPPKTAPRAERVAANLYRWKSLELGDWRVTRFTRDPEGKVPGYCTATVGFDGDLGMRIESNSKTTTYAFRGADSMGLGATVKVGYWFNARKVDRKDLAFKLITDPEEGTRWLAYTQSNSEPGDDGLYLNSKSVNYAYRVSGKEFVQSFPLAGANVALKKLFECAKQ